MWLDSGRGTRRGLFPAARKSSRLSKKQSAVLSMSMMMTQQSVFMPIAMGLVNIPQLAPMIQVSVYPMRNSTFYTALQSQISSLDANSVEHLRPGLSKDFDTLKTRLDNLLRNNLFLDDRGFGPGEGPIRYFLSAEVRKEDLPWDTEETDW